MMADLERLIEEQRSREWLLLTERMLEAERRLLHMATSNADDWRWYQNQARQACRALGIVGSTGGSLWNERKVSGE